MNSSQKIRPAFSAVALFVAAQSLVLSPGAHAYIDGGTMSMMFQLLVAGAIGLAFSVKMFWYNVKAFFAGLFGKEVPASASTAVEEAPADE